MADDKYLKCRFCEFKVPKYYRRKDGAVKSGWKFIHEHIELEHPGEAAKIMMGSNRR